MRSSPATPLEGLKALEGSPAAISGLGLEQGECEGVCKVKL